MRLTNGMRLPLTSILGGTAEDPSNNGKPLKFEQEKDTSVPTYTATAKDGTKYTISLDNVIVTVAVGQQLDVVEQRRRGYPIKKEDIKRADEQIKREEEEQQKKREQLASPQVTAPTPATTTTQSQSTSTLVPEARESPRGRPKS